MLATLRQPSLAAVMLVLALCAPVAHAQVEVRIKDITDIEGVRSNKLTGLGLVTGLNNTGGKTPITREFLQNMLQKFGLRSDPLQRLNARTDAQTKTNNLSVVAVTAELPPFIRRGQHLDVVVSTMDDATSLQGGQLMLTPLYGVDDQVYAVADGSVSIGGFSFSGEAATVQKNHPTTGRIPNGAVVEKEVCMPPIGLNGYVRLLLRRDDYETARRMTLAINERYPETANLVDARTVNLRVPAKDSSAVNTFLGIVTSIYITPDLPATVVINERTGTVILGENVKLSRVAITHANLAVITGESPQVSQPAPFSQGETTVVPRTSIDVIEEQGAVQVMDSPATVGDLAQALNALGVTPRDLSSIFQQLKESGALHAELKFK
ncbi:MAG: flagellar basal body P-ring protein FlgI [Planctomycetales bacterium]|nr:flagellar basal body P-ring protein FlgI [Planctomycetales bacterium]MCA9202808.1 flagellar basal body P-ring protein FlgI [Planctomycetales bacterium]